MNLFLSFSIVLTLFCIAGAGTRTDTLYASGGAYLTRMSTPSAGITRANIDTSHTRHATADSATIPIFKGNETHRDSAYFAGGLRGLRLYTPQATIDSIIGLLKIGDSLYVGKPSGLSATSKKTITFRSGGFAEPAPYLQGSNGDKLILYRDLASVYDGTIGVGSSGNLWIKSVGAAGAASVEVYVDSACAAPKFRVTKDSIKCNETVFADSGIVTTTLNTGNGDNELYPMDQAALTTSDVTHDSVTVTDLKVTDDATIDDDLNVTGTITGNLTGNVTGNCSGSSGSCTGNAATATTATNVSGGTVSTTSLTLNSGTALTTYEEGTFTATVTGMTGTVTGTARYVVVGKNVLIDLPSYVTGTSNSVGMTITGLPSVAQPTATRKANPTWCINNGSDVCAYTSVSGGTISLYPIPSGEWTASGTKGIHGGTISYYK